MPRNNLPARFVLLVAVATSPAVAGCECGSKEPENAPVSQGAAPPKDYGVLDRARFNQLAVRANVPVFWVEDTNGDEAVDPGEVRALRFYPTQGAWTEEGAFTPGFDAVYERLVALDGGDPGASAQGDEQARRRLVARDLDQGKPTLVENSFANATEAERALVQRMLTVASLIDTIYAKQTGMHALAARVEADDVASQSLFRRNWGPKCLAPNTENEEGCSAIAGAPKPVVDTYPASLQSTDDFCTKLTEREDAETLLAPFVVVREREGALVPVPYNEAYSEESQQIANELRAAADEIEPADEGPLAAYLRAAAQAFLDNEWAPADEAWAAMNVRNSKWYVRVGPDEVYWEPCSRKAGYHLTFARINDDSLEWQDKLSPLRQDMEQALATLSGGAYRAQDAAFHLPDFIEIVINSGDDRNPFGATIGQSLPNWGAVREEKRGRTVAMTNLYTDPDSRDQRKRQAGALLDEATLGELVTDPLPGLLGTIIHEAGHNLGPTSGYTVHGDTPAKAFGGPMASMLEELKAQTQALYFLQLLEEREVIDAELARQALVANLTWALGHVSRGMYTADGRPKPYSQLAAIQLGFLMEEGAVTWDAETKAANGEDDGAFHFHVDALPAAITKLMAQVITIKATHDKAAAEALVAKYVDGDVVPKEAIRERFNRFPKASFVYTITL